MIGRTHRRGEAHLWLLLEEALVSVQGMSRESAAVREALRHHRYVAGALAAVGIVPWEVADAITAELQDALVVRGALDIDGFTGAVFPVEATVAPMGPGASAVATWLEAEIERHLDLVAWFDPETQPAAGNDAIRLLQGPLRAFEAAGVLGDSGRLVDDLSASLAAAGYRAGPIGREDGRVRREWVQFLRTRPKDPQPFDPPVTERPLRLAMGELAGQTVKVNAIGWSKEHIGITIDRGSWTGPNRATGTPWLARVMDDRGRLHLGQPGNDLGLHTLISVLTFSLRPGLTDETKKIELRITAGGERLDVAIAL